MSFDKVDSAIILAAGLSRRFGLENKLLAPWRGRPLVSHVIEAAARSSLRKVFLVTGQDGDAVAALATDPKFSLTHNADFGDGLASSLQAGIRATQDGPILILLGDMPLVGAGLIDEICGAWRTGAYALVPTFEGQLGNPVILGPDARQDSMSLSGDRGARGLLEGRTDVIRHPVGDPAILQDFDSPQHFFGEF